MDVQKDSEMLKALGHPVRLKMVKGLIENQCNVNKIVSILNLPQSTVSQHLGVLRSQGIVEPRKEGVRTLYCVTDKRVKQIIRCLNKH